MADGPNNKNIYDNWKYDLRFDGCTAYGMYDAIQVQISLSAISNAML